MGTGWGGSRGCCKQGAEGQRKGVASRQDRAQRADEQKHDASGQIAAAQRSALMRPCRARSSSQEKPINQYIVSVAPGPMPEP